MPSAEPHVDSPQVRWNFNVIVTESTAFWAGISFFDPSAVMPVLLAKLGASDLVVGSAGLLMKLGFAIPALFAAHYVHGRRRHLGLLLASCLVGRAGMLFLPFILLFVAPDRPGLAVSLIMALYALFWLADGACVISWFDIIAKTIPARVRGRFFGLMQALGGVAGVLAGLATERVLSKGGLPFPANYALLAGFWCVGLAVSQVFLMQIREPDGAVIESEERPGLLEYLRGAPALLSRWPRFRRALIARFFVEGAAFATPFYALHAQRGLNVDLKQTGIYLASLSLGRVLGGPFWGRIGDRRGPPDAFFAVSLCTVFVPVLALGAAPERAWMMVAAFFVLGAVSDGLWMTATNVNLEATGERDRPLALGVATVCLAASAANGIFGGMVSQRASYEAVFWVAASFALVGACLAHSVRSTPIRLAEG